MPFFSGQLPKQKTEPWYVPFKAAWDGLVDAFNNLIGTDNPQPLGPVPRAGSQAGPAAAADHVHSWDGLATATDLEQAVITGGGTPPTRQILTGAGLTGGGDLTTDRTFAVQFGTTSGTVTAGDDARIGGAVQAATVTGTSTGYILTSKVTNDLLARVALRGDGTLVTGEPPLTVSNVTGTSTVTVTTSTNHGYATGDVVTISGVQSYTGANGMFTITRTSATQFTLNSATGSGTYTSGGTAQRNLGGTGSSLEGVWNFVLPDTSRDGMVLRGRESSSKNLITFRDYLGNLIASIGQFGGFGVFGDKIFTTTNAFGRTWIANENGGFRAAAGDPAGGVDVFALGNAATPPTGNPDGSHLGEGSFTTTAGVIFWAANGRPRLRTQTGHEDDLLSRHERVTFGITATGGAASFQTWGCAAPTVTTPGAAAAQTDSSTGNQVQISTNTTSGNVASIVPSVGTGTHSRPWLSPLFFARMATDSTITSLRLVVGMSSADISGNAGPASTGTYTTAAGAWFRYDTGVDGTAFWRCVTGSGSNATVTTTTVAVAASTVYNLTIEFTGNTSVQFRINSAVVATHTTNLPSTSQTMGYQVSVTTLTTAARLLRLNHLTVNQL
jgi:hypothetical protein